MLDRFFVMPETVDRIRSSWIGECVERYVAWMTERNFASRTVCRRVPVLIRFGEFARGQGASTVQELPGHCRLVCGPMGCRESGAAVRCAAQDGRQRG